MGADRLPHYSLWSKSDLLEKGDLKQQQLEYEINNKYGFIHSGHSRTFTLHPKALFYRAESKGNNFIGLSQSELLIFNPELSASIFDKVCELEIGSTGADLFAIVSDIDSKSLHKFEPMDFETPQGVVPFADTFMNSSYELVIAKIVHYSQEADRWVPLARESVSDKLTKKMISRDFLSMTDDGLEITQKALMRLANRYLRK